MLMMVVVDEKDIDVDGSSMALSSLFTLFDSQLLVGMIQPLPVHAHLNYEVLEKHS